MEDGSGGGGLVFLIQLAVFVITIVAMWKIFTKAGQPGWASIVPIYNVIVLLQIINRPLWWVVLFFIPIVNLVIYLIVMIDLANRFGKGAGFAIGMFFLPFIFYPLLAFSDAQYQGGAAAAPAPAPQENPPQAPAAQ